MSKIVVGLSGGVDSAVAAHLLLEQGHELIAVFMKNWDEDDSADHCPAAADLADARDIAARLGIELQTVSFSAEYWQRVFTQFLHEYQAGRTPSPDIVCNREIKFRAFLAHATGMGAEYIATGHYVAKGVEHGIGALDRAWRIRRVGVGRVQYVAGHLGWAGQVRLVARFGIERVGLRAIRQDWIGAGYRIGG